MREVSAREANHRLSGLLAAVEGGEEVVITRHGRPVAVLSPYRAPTMTPERHAAIAEAEAAMERGLAWKGASGRFDRDEMHER